ncbi:MAG: hypothetical protein IKA17_08020 [Clostridia bacterium]|nr:hypothetical protein [Clostridia bacterium]
MYKEELLKQELYVVVLNITQTPYMMNGGFFMLYTDKEKAMKFARNINGKESIKYGEASVINTSLITNNELFFDIMIRMGCDRFLLNGNGEIIKFGDSSLQVAKGRKEIYESYLLHKRLSKSSHIGKAKAAQIQRLESILKAPANKGAVSEFFNMLGQLSSCFKAIDSGMTATTRVNSSIGTLVNGVNVQNYNKKMSYGRLSRNWGIASILLYAWFFPPIVAIVYGIRSILFTKSNNEPIDKKAIWGLVLAGFGLFMLYAMMSGMSNS